jgi:hypothetical protein
MRDTELMAKWFEDIGAALHRRIGGLDAAALEWRADDRGNNVRETVWHMARWIDVLERLLSGAPASTEHWIADGWAERTRYDPRGIGDELLTYLDSVIGPVAQRLRAPANDDVTAKMVRRATGILQGCFGHIGEIDALLAIRERTAQRAPA